MKSKSPKTIFRCGECGYAAYQWLGKCPDCGMWNTFRDVPAETRGPRGAGSLPTVDLQNVKKLSEMGEIAAMRLPVGLEEVDRVLGGGLCLASTVLLAGDPGIGKSTLLLQIAEKLSERGESVLYVSGEEALEQIRDRAKRLCLRGTHVLLLSEIRLEAIESYVEKVNPRIVIIDSIQAIASERFDAPAGSLTQVRECALILSHFMRARQGVLVLIGHVTKDGTLAGPKALEHLVDTVLYFEGDRYQSFRILRAIKNRYGAAGEMSLFDMQPHGLTEVKNPSEIFLSDSSQPNAGRATAAILEGNRPLLVEIQALVNKTCFNNPVRRAVGLDPNRVSLLLAVIEKSLGLNFFQHDVFLKVVGGLQIDEPGADLAVALAMLSSLADQPLPPGVVAIGELGLAGEVRRVRHLDRRIQEASRLHFQLALVPPRSAKGTHEGVLEVVGVRTLKEAFDALLPTPPRSPRVTEQVV